MMNFDEQPVGQHKQLDISEQPTSPAESAPAAEKVIPLAERVVSKNSKTRLDAMADLLKLFTDSEPESEAFLEYYPNFPKYLADTHPGAQEKAIDAFIVMLSKSSPAVGKTLSDSITVLIEKCLTSAKTQSKVKSIECLLALSQLEPAHASVKDCIKELLKPKTSPKVSSAAMHALTQLLSNFGNRYFPVKEYINLVTTLAGSTNAQVRTEALNYLKEGYKWEKTVILKAVEGLRQAQQDDLKKQFAELNDPPQPKMSVKGAKKETTEELKKEEVQQDNYMLAAEVPVLKKFGDQWCSQFMAAKKWSEKRDKLEELLKAVSVEKIKNENFSELGKTLKIVLQDPNIVVSNLVLRVIGQLANGLRSHFATYAKHIFEPVVQKCKDKKSLNDAQKCLENLAYSLKLEDMTEIIKEALADKSPLVKSKVCAWLESVVFPKVGATLAKNMANAFAPVLSKLTDDAASEVRESALSCLGAMKAFLNDDSGLNKMIGELNAQKQEKLLKAAEEAKVKKGEKVEEEVTEVANPEPEEIPAITAADESNTLEEEVKDPEMPPAEESKDEPKDVAPKPKPMAKAPAKKKKDPKVSKPPKEVPIEDVGPIISLEDATTLVSETIPSEILTQFDMTEWKERQKGLQDLNDWLQKNTDKTQGLLEPVTVWLKSKLKDFRENNQGIMKECLALLQYLANTCIVTKKFAHETVPALVEKMNDLKTLETCMNTILCISDSATPSYVATLAVKCGYTSKSINVLKSIFSLFNKMLDGYGPNMLPLKVTIEYAKHCLTHANPQVRNSATHYIAAVHSITGDLIKPWLTTDLKEAAYKNLEAEFARTQPKAPGEIKRVLKGESAEVAAKNKKKDLADSLAPRANISSQITSKIISGLTDSSMKHRQEAKDAIEKILTAANNRILPTGLNPLLTVLKGRMSEPCKNLAKGFIALIGNLALAMGQGFRQCSKIIIQPLMYNLADKQAAIRSETVTAMDKIAEAAGPEIVLNNLGSLLEKDNPDTRNALLSWILKNKDALVKCDCQNLVSPLVAAMQDRSKEIRGLAEQVVGEVMTNVGHAAFASAIQDLKPVVKLSLQNVLDKCKTNGIPKPEQEDTKEPPKAESTIQVQVKPPSEVPPPDSTKPQEPEPNNLAPPTFEKSSSKKSKPPLDRSFTGEKSSSKQERIGEMPTSRSSNDLQKQNGTKPQSKTKEVKKISKPLSRTTSKLASQSPSKSQMSSNSNNTLSVETVVLTTIGNKQKRAEQDKTIKWPINEIREDYVEKLKKVLRNVLHPNLFDSMFAPQFKKNFAAVNVLTEGLKEEFPSMLDLFDLLCKWVVIKMVDQSNTAMTKALIEFLAIFFKKMEETKYQMMDFEAAAILPMLCERIGINNAGFRQQIGDLLKMSCQLYNPTKVTGHMLNALETTKNQKTKLECLGLMKDFTVKYGARLFAPKDIKSFVKLLSSSDNTLKAQALDLLVEIYKFRTESIWSLIGDIPEKVKDLLKKKFGAIPKLDRPLAATEYPLNSTVKEQRSATPNLDFSITSSVDGREKSGQKDSVLEKSAILTVDRPITAAIEEKSPLRDSTPLAEKEDLSPLSSELHFNATGKISFMSKWDNEKKIPQYSARKTPTSPFTQKQESEPVEADSLLQALETLTTGDISKRVDALMCLNDKATSTLEKEKEALIQYGDQLFITFATVLKEIFDKQAHDIPIRFAKYFMTVINKICLNKPVLRGIGERPVFLFAEQLLTKLLYEGLDKMGDNNEGEYLVKAFNSTMLRILENCNPTKSFVMLIELFKTYKNVSAMTGNVKTGKLPSLIVKCILKLTKVMSSLVPTLNVSRVLVALHEYLLENPSNAAPKTANDDIGIRIAKTIINDLVKVRGEHIWQDYKGVESHEMNDTHIKRWINLVLKSTHPACAATPQTNENRPAHTIESPDELKEIFKGLNSQATFQDAIKSLSEYMARHPQLDLSQYFVSCSKGFRDYIMTSLQKYDIQTKPGSTLGDTMRSTRELILSSPREQKDPTISAPTPKPTSSSLSEYKAKLALLKKKFDIGSKDEKMSRKGMAQAYQTVNK